jgi:hypothetical protein
MENSAEVDPYYHHFHLCRTVRILYIFTFQKAFTLLLVYSYALQDTAAQQGRSYPHRCSVYASEKWLADSTGISKVGMIQQGESSTNWCGQATPDSPFLKDQLCFVGLMSHLTACRHFQSQHVWVHHGPQVRREIRVAHIISGFDAFLEN